MLFQEESSSSLEGMYFSFTRRTICLCRPRHNVTAHAYDLAVYRRLIVALLSLFLFIMSTSLALFSPIFGNHCTPLRPAVLSTVERRSCSRRAYRRLRTYFFFFFPSWRQMGWRMTAVTQYVHGHPCGLLYIAWTYAYADTVHCKPFCLNTPCATVMCSFRELYVEGGDASAWLMPDKQVRRTPPHYPLRFGVSTLLRCTPSTPAV